MAFFSADAPVESASWFDEVVVDPAQASPAALARLQGAGVRVIAALAGEAGAHLDPAALRRRGFAGFLFDGREAGSAVDRCAAVLRQMPDAPVYWRGPASALEGLAARPRLVVDAVLTARDGVAPAGTWEQRLAALQALKGRLHLPEIVVVEHVAEGERVVARALARAIAERGLVPWVTVGRHALGVGLREPVPRRILAVYNGEDEADVASTVVHRLAAVPLEYLGYAVDYLDVRGALPAGDLGARYAGIVTWFNSDDISDGIRFREWLIGQLDRGVRVAVMGRLGVPPSPALLSRLGLVQMGETAALPVRITRTSALVGFEAPPAPRGYGLLAVAAGPGAVAHVELADARGRRLTPVVISRAGGVALQPYLLEQGFADTQRWIVDPFAFFTEALDLQALPAPDPTTEKGRRLLLVHVDGDGFVSRAELPRSPYGGEVILREFLRRYRVPTTVSIIEGETGPTGLYPALSPGLEAIARAIFRLPHVEAASHSYGHPFHWMAAATGTGVRADGLTREGDPVHLAIPGYRYSAAREVDGSVRYIDHRLLPPGKTTRTFLWSGNALPGPDAMDRVAALGLANMNGNNSEWPHDTPTLAQVPSFGREVGGHLQVYAPAHNENVYTNEWKGPFYGFRNVIALYRFTESPRRLKPIDIYYHFYSGTKPAAIAALHEVYRWALAQQTFPVHASEMAARVEGFQRATLARRWDGAWELRGLGALHTVRLDRRLGRPDLAASTGVTGVTELPQGRYVALDPAGGTVTLVVEAGGP